MMRIGARLIVAACWSVASAASAAPLDEAQELIDQGRYEQALSLLDREIAAAPNTPEPRFLRGIALAQLGRYDEAVEVFEALTEAFPQLPEPYNNLAVIHAQRGDYQSAREALEAALATHPSYATAHENLGDLYAAMAGAAYNRALMLDEDNPALRGKLALIDQMHDAPQTSAGAARTPVVPRESVAVAPHAAAAPGWYVQAGSYSKTANAQQARARIQAMGLPVFIGEVKTPNGLFQRVRSGPFRTREDAERARVKIEQSRIPASVVQDAG